MPRHWLFSVLFALLSPVASLAAAPAFSAGAAAVDLTPEPGTLNWVTHRPYKGVLDRIHVRALVLGSDAERIAILTLDLTDINETDTVEIRQAVSAAISVPPRQILVNASHTHSGPTSPRYEWVSNPSRTMAADPNLEQWIRQLPGRCADAARQAEAGRRPVALAVGRATVGEWLFNRRPVRPDGNVKTMMTPADPTALPEGLRFGQIDPTATVLSFRDADGKSVATLLHLACHAVSVYSANEGVSADWPGAACASLAQSLGGEVLFLQGCAGDIVPARRGVEQAREMGAFIARRAATAVAQALPLAPAPLSISRAIVALPLTAAASARMGQQSSEAEIQVISCGDLALVALPGEPLIGLSLEIQKQSPFPHTLVLGYSNGDGVEYVGLPGEKIKGGYEMGPDGRGTDECGGMMVATALRLLREHRAQPPRR